MTQTSDTIEQLRQVELALDGLINASMYKDHPGQSRMAIAALALMPAIIASVEEMGKPVIADQPDALLPTGLAECKDADEYNALLDRRLAAKESDACRKAFEAWCRQDGQTGDIATDANGNYFDSTNAEWKAWQAAWNARPSERESGEPPRRRTQGYQPAQGSGEPPRPPQGGTGAMRESGVRANRIASGGELVCPECKSHVAWVDAFEDIGEVVRPHKVQANENEDVARRGLE